MSRRALERWKWACNVAPNRLTGAQRAILQVIAAHATADGAGARVGQEAMAQSAGISDRGARKALVQLQKMGLIAGEPRPGKTTIYALNADWTPEPQFRAPRNHSSTVTRTDPGTTPELPRNPSSYEGEGEGTSTSTPLSLNGAAARQRENGNVTDFSKQLAASLSMNKPKAGRA